MNVQHVQEVGGPVYFLQLRIKLIFYFGRVLIFSVFGEDFQAE